MHGTLTSLHPPSMACLGSLALWRIRGGRYPQELSLPAFCASPPIWSWACACKSWVRLVVYVYRFGAITYSSQPLISYFVTVPMGTSGTARVSQSPSIDLVRIVPRPKYFPHSRILPGWSGGCASSDIVQVVGKDRSGNAQTQIGTSCKYTACRRTSPAPNLTCILEGVLPLIQMKN